MNWTSLLTGSAGPVLTAIFGIAGIILGRYIGHGIRKDGEEKLNPRLNVAMTILFCLAVVGYVMDNPETRPLRMLGYSGTAGFIGLAALEFVADQLFERFKAAWGAFMDPRSGDDDHDTGIKNAMDKLHKIEVDDGPSNK